MIRKVYQQRPVLALLPLAVLATATFLAGFVRRRRSAAPAPEVLLLEPRKPPTPTQSHQGKGEVLLRQWYQEHPVLALLPVFIMASAAFFAVLLLLR